MRSPRMLCALLSVTLLANPVFADGKSDAQAQFLLGQEAYKKDDYTTAIKYFEEAYKLDPNPVYLYNIAVAYELWGNKGKSAEYYEKYYPDADPKEKASIQAKINELRPPINVAPPLNADGKSKIDIRTEPAGAKVWLEEKKGSPLGVTPFTYEVTPGKHLLIIESEGYAPITRSFEVLAAQTASIDLAMAKKEGKEGAVMIAVQSNVTDAKVYIDDRSQGVAGMTPFQMMVAPGTHTIIAEKEGYAPFTKELNIKAEDGGGPVTISFEMEKGNYGRLQVNPSVKGAMVEIDGKKLGSAPFSGDLPKVATGSHKITVSAPGYNSWSDEIEVSNGSTVQVKTTLMKKPGKKAAVIFFGLAAGFAVGGFILGKDAQSVFASIDDDIKAGEPVDDADPRFREGFITGLEADVCFGLGGVSGLVSLTRFFAKGKKSKGEVFNAVNPVAQIIEEQTHPALIPAPMGIKTNR
jgi:hypothetical protein